MSEPALGFQVSLVAVVCHSSPDRVNLHLNQMNRWFYILTRECANMRRFERKQNVFANKDALGESYQPDRIEERDEEIEEYMHALQPIIDGWEPNNVFVYGNTGVGKTAVTEYLLDRLQTDVKAYEDVDLSVISLNCKTLNSSYQVAVELVNELRPPGNEISSTGYPQQTVFNKLYDELEAIGGTVLLVLDEVDSIGERDELLYELPRARAHGNLDRTKIGLIGISNDFKFRNELDPRVQDTLCERELQFPPYDAPELEDILRSRADIALRDGVLADGVLGFCAALAARDSGSARQALDLLRLAGEIAENDDDDRIELDHAERAQSKLEQERVEEGMRELTTHGRLALLRPSCRKRPSRRRRVGRVPCTTSTRRFVTPPGPTRSHSARYTIISRISGCWGSFPPPKTGVVLVGTTTATN